MKNKNVLKKIVAPFVLIASLWIIVILIQFFNVKNSTENIENSIPNNANFVIKLDTKSILNESAIQLLFEAKDQDVLTKMNEKLSEPREQDLKIGVNFLSEIIAFTIDNNKNTVKGVCLNIKNKKEFSENIATYLKTDQFFYLNNSKGYIFSPSVKMSQQEIDAFISKEILSTSAKKITLNKNNTNEIQFITNGETLGKNTIFKSSEISINTVKNSITLTGELVKSKNQLKRLNNIDYQINKNKKSFHFSSGIIPKTIQDTLDFFLNKIDLNLPEIKTISFNYSGLEMGESMMLPNINLIVQFHKNVSISSFLTNASIVNKLEAEVKENTLKIENKIYYFTQINSNTISIGTDKNITYTKAKETVLNTNGNLASLFEIKNGGMFVSFLEGIPVYKAPKTLFNASEDFSLTIKNDKNTYKLNGNLTFKEGHYSMNEMIKFILEIQAIF